MKHDTKESRNYLLLLYLGLHHLELSRWWFLVGHQLLRVPHPAEQRLQGILEPPTVQQGLLQLCCSLGHLQNASRSNLLLLNKIVKFAHQPPPCVYVYLPI